MDSPAKTLCDTNELLFNLTSALTPKNIHDCARRVNELIQQQGLSVLIGFVRSLFLVYSVLSNPETSQLVTADHTTVESVIKGLLNTSSDSSIAASLILQALATTKDDSESSIDHHSSTLRSLDENSLGRILSLLGGEGYWTSLTVISTLAKTPSSAFCTQAKSLLSSYLARFPEERNKLGSNTKDTLSLIFDNLSSIGVLPKGQTPPHTASTRPAMGIAEHIIRAGPRASVADVVASYVQQQSAGDGSASALTSDEVAKAIAQIASQTGQDGEWNAEEFAQAVNQHSTGLNWEDIIYRLPNLNLNIQHESGVSFIVNAFLAATASQSRPFPYSFMYEIWPNAQSQISFLRFAMRAASIAPSLLDKHMPAVVTDALESLYWVYRPEFARIISSPWNSLSLILVISHLLDSKASDDARALLDYGISQEPLLITLALARLKIQHPRLQALLQHNVARFLKREFGHSGLFFELFRIFEKKVMLALFCNLYRKDPSHARNILGVLVDLGVINEILLLPKREDIAMLDFVVEIAVFASRRGYVVFESWFPGLLAELGNDMLHASLEILHTKLQLEAARQRGEDAGVSVYSPSELTIIFKSLGVMTMSPNNAANLKALYAQYLELAPALERIENEHSTDEGRIEKEAENLFLRLYRGELSVDRMVDVLEDLHDSLRLHMRKTYAHVIQYPLEEFGFFDNYPEKELTITGQLVGVLLQRHMLVPSREPAILDMIIRALQSAPSSKPFHFGMTALQACMTRIEQLPVFCAAIYQIPAFRQNTNSPVVELVQSIISCAMPQHGSKDGDGGHAPGQLGGSGNGVSGGIIAYNSPSGVASTGLVFRSLRPSPLPVIDGPYGEPSEEARDKIQFAINNLSPSNIAEKTSEVDSVLQPRHFVWFSQDIIVKRASQEPNYHALYLQFVDALNRPLLTRCILRETLASIARLLNAESTISSSTDRGYLKNLGAWLGGITLARDQPILRENVSFKDLLCEGYSSSRLLVAIPFVCKVLEQAARSTVFHPPNPWLMSIMRVLSELYVTASLKLNLTFEIEVLCKALNLDVKEITPSSILGGSANSQRGAVDMLAAELAQSSIGGRMSVGPVGTVSRTADSLGAAGLSSGAISMPVLTGEDITVDILTVLTQHASFHAAESLFAQQPNIKKTFFGLTERMIREIIPIHVARSIFVAVSCTRDTVQKDLCTEPNEENLHRAAQVMARGLAGALAVSLCREQLKSKLYLTMREFLIGHDVPEQSANSIAVGLVADNLDLACAIAEKESIERASVQIDAVLSDSYNARKQTRGRTGQPFYDMARFNRLVYPPDFPDMLKVRLNGLQPGHLRIYEEFTQIPHFFSQIGGAGSQGVHGPSVAPGLVPGGGSGDGVLAQSDFGGAAGAGDSGPKYTTGQCYDRFLSIVSDLDKVIASADPNVSLSQLPSQHQACLFARDILVLSVHSASPEETAMDFAQALVNCLYRAETSLGIDLYVLLLARMCEMSVRVSKEVTAWLAFADDERKNNVPATIALINEGLIGIDDEDDHLARLVEASRTGATEFAALLVRKAVLEQAIPATLRSFAKTIQAFVKLAQNGRAPLVVSQLLEDIQSAQQQGPPGTNSPAPIRNAAAKVDIPSRSPSSTQVTTADNLTRSQETVSYQNILFNWTRVYDHPAAGDAELATLVSQLRQQVPLQESSVAAAFFRACVEASVSFFDQTALRSGAAAAVLSASGYQVSDALVRLVIFLTKLGPVEGQSDALQPIRMFLSSTALLVVHSHASSPELFAVRQKPFFRLLCSVLYELNAASHAQEQWCTPKMIDDVVKLFGETLLLLGPETVPGFSFVWLMLVSHRHFFPRLMANKQHWGLAASLLERQLRFLEPFIANGQVSESLKMLYRGTVCVILVVLHDFPEFLADYALRLCNPIPVSCVQLRNLLLSAYPRDMRLPEPLTPNLKIDLLPDVVRSPSISFDYMHALEHDSIGTDLGRFLTSQTPDNFVKRALAAVLTRGETGGGSTTSAASKPAMAEPNASAKTSTDARATYDVARINAFVLHAVAVITQIEDGPSRDSAQRVALELFRTMLAGGDAEGCYLLVSAIANQLRFPSAHTYLCSRMILALFSKSEERVRECIARVLIERILVNRPFPWGLLVTLIELLRNPYYAFWNHDFTRRSPQIIEILSAVAKSIHPIESRAVPQTSQSQSVA
ncbi:CCR4-NOT core subunit cdc39 [Coemansia interrupta]|uniref:General negative regulator of transcription subunit 1 n=1 Tax=Coemansia interrupta TaxID=1126814 RepID=A0A9W8HL36_9FUNG|nr:CCR4-NOT core subunit cdc39 [Coemansia interrupta]